MMPPGMKDTHIVLIPKCKRPKSLSQFRPISLCNVIYIIASKTIANRLKQILDKIISPAQSAFYPGRLISDNILLAFELNHFLNTKSKRGQGFMALKLDVSKAYDKVEWPFLEQVELEGRIPEVSICRGAPRISHLLFANDTLIFSSASSATSRAILDVLEIYRHASGQELNFVKSSVAFSKNTKSEDHRLIAATLQIRMENKMELYLGLPSKVARSKKDLFATIRDRVWQRISGWNAKLLSQVGKDVIIKSIIQAIPSYAMGCFRLPTTLLSELHRMVAQFWWGNRAVAKFIGSPGTGYVHRSLKVA
ncbi:UNVERIFIED_CONTAM: hypothetical protein Sangu_2981900 [Sesamum angustifolium]|uniref:Reverse transcriptase domain-containing protein n=1 Tax=Sesamum angustifolium TaxID=2727405 RepID=A0AAW2IJL3_9LAMI